MGASSPIIDKRKNTRMINNAGKVKSPFTKINAAGGDLPRVCICWMFIYVSDVAACDAGRWAGAGW
jgi:hypothetical protein